MVETYGTPEEIAEEYKSMEAAISGPFPKAESRASAATASSTSSPIRAPTAR